MIIEIGNKPLKELTQEDALQIAIIEGCIPSLDYWNVPNILNYNTTMFSDTNVLSFESYRTSDNICSGEFNVFLDIKKFSFHYTRDYEMNREQENKGSRFGLETIYFLIKQGYHIPFEEQK